MTKNLWYSFLVHFIKSDKEYYCEHDWNKLTVTPDDKDLGLSVSLEPDQLLPSGSISCQASLSNTTETIRHSTLDHRWSLEKDTWWDCWSLFPYSRKGDFHACLSGQQNLSRDLDLKSPHRPECRPNTAIDGSAQVLTLISRGGGDYVGKSAIISWECLP